jgi:hypothetical protein
MAPAESTRPPPPAEHPAQGGPPAISTFDQLMQLVGRAWMTQMIETWEGLLHSVHMGDGAFRHRYGMSVFDSIRPKWWRWSWCRRSWRAS